MYQRVDAPHSHPGGIAWPQREAPRLILRAHHLDQHEHAAERRLWRDRPHAGDRRQPQPQPLVRAHKGRVLDLGAPQRWAGQLLGRGRQRDILGPKEHLHRALAAARPRLGAERKVQPAELYAVGRAAPDQQVRRAQEGRHELGLWTLVQLGRRADLQQPADVHHADPVGQLEGLLLVVGDKDRGRAQLALDGPQRAAQVDPNLGVQRAERLVEQQHLGLIRQGTSQRHALLLAARELARHARAQPAQPGQLEQFVAAAAALGRRHLADAQAELDVLGHRHMAEQGVVLEHKADAPLLDRGQPGDHTQDGALAAAAWPQQHEELAIRHLQRHIVDHWMIRVALAELIEYDRHR